MTRIAINGFGRIGRILFRILSNYSQYQVVVVNDIASPKILSHLLKYDSVHGQFSKNISYTKDAIIVNDQKISVLSEPSLNQLSWHEFNVDVVFECTGLFKTFAENMLHIKAGAKKVLLSAPPINSDIPMTVLGVNDHLLDFSNTIISNASCTTNCAAPMIKVLNDAFGLLSAYVTTVHSYTSDQNLHDGIHNDLRRARSAPNSIIPTTTGAAKALSCIFPNIDIGGCGIRVPVSNCSLTDITCIVDAQTDINTVNNLFKNSANNELNSILYYNTDPIVSVDVLSNTHSCVFDSQLTYVLGNMIKVVGWYDNEYGYCSRLVDLLKKSV
ncbi:MAG: type I glyceraldehyde-3-phosphate dehydrogenase [Flavobacteriales bacterium]|nr:type I glyceraldehyde-3-phosphate dehydrogenase [Flavobacteriales bacterium]|tara:strand:+ start:807 stop:1790 length:984 start_codon:yes stop_codon:yes gene_type:complete